MIDLILAAAMLQAPAAAPDPCSAAGAAPPASAHCPAWRLLWHNAGGEMSVDPASIQRSGDGFDIAARIVFSTERPDRGRSATGRLRIECRLRTYSLLHVIPFNADGSQRSNASSTATQPKLLLATGPMVDLLNEFCPAQSAAERRAALQHAAGEWRSVSRDSEAEVLFDTVAAERSGETVTIRTLMVFAVPTSDGVRSNITWFRINCAAGTASQRHMTVFRDDGIPFIDEEMTGANAAEQPVTLLTFRAELAHFCPG